MKPTFCSLLLALVALLASFQTQASSSLSFEGDGYQVDMELGHDEQPDIASITFHTPGDAQGVLLRGNYVVEKFDSSRRRLVLRYDGADARVKPFTLVVQGEKAALQMGDERVESIFSWDT